MNKTVENIKVCYFENADKPQQKAFIKAQNNCVLCNTVLEIKHTKGDEPGQVKEEAFCPQCEVKTRAKNFTLN